MSMSKSMILANKTTIAIHLVRLILRLLVRLVARSVHPTHGCRPLVPCGLSQRAAVMKMSHFDMRGERYPDHLGRLG